MKKILTLNFLILLYCILPFWLSAQKWIQLNPPFNLFDRPIYSIRTDAAGHIYAAGDFRNAAGEYFVAYFDGNTWRELGEGGSALKANGPILAMEFDKQGRLFAGGNFLGKNGNLTIKQWDGQNWTELNGTPGAAPTSGVTYSMATDLTGNLYTAGSYYDETDKYYIGKWNGTTWSRLGTGSTALKANGFVYALKTDGAGNVYAAGSFKDAQGKYYVAKWDGSNWSALGNLAANQPIETLQFDAQGRLYAAGRFTDSAGGTYVARWEANQWSPVGTGTHSLNGNGRITSLAIASSGAVYAAGVFTNGANSGYIISKWNGADWVQQCDLGYGINYTYGIEDMTLDNNGILYAGGGFVDNSSNSWVAKWDGQQLSEPGKVDRWMESNEQISTVRADSKGQVYALGIFYDRNQEYYLSRWDGHGWIPEKNLANDAPHTSLNRIGTIAIDTVDNVYVAGNGVLNSSYKPCVAKWDGTKWTEVDNPAQPLNATSIERLERGPSGGIYASCKQAGFGNSKIVKWDGNGWIPIGGGGSPGKSLFTVDAKGIIYVVGNGGNGSETVYRCIGGNWDQLGSGDSALKLNNFITAITTDRQGNVYIGGRYRHFPADSLDEGTYVMKWDGQRWSELGHHKGFTDVDFVNELLADPAGNIYAAISASPDRWAIMKWDGDTWQTFGDRPVGSYSSALYTIAIDGLGNLYTSGILGILSQHFVAKYGNAYALLAKPILNNLSSDYCSGSGIRKIYLSNPPSSLSKVSIKLDNNLVAVQSDSSFLLDPATLTQGTHNLVITYSNNAENSETRLSFNVIASISQDVNLQADKTIITDYNIPVTLTANNILGGGAAPLFTFAKDRAMIQVLQAESTASIMNLFANNLVIGDNWIYVRMRNSESCFSSQFVLDSIKINRSAVTGITDIDFPGQIINCYPNPFVGQLQLTGLQTSKSYWVTLQNMQGQVLFQSQIRLVANKTLLFPTLPMGIYRLCLYGSKTKSLLGTIPVIKQ